MEIRPYCRSRFRRRHNFSAGQFHPRELRKKGQVSGTTVDVIRIATAEIGTRETGTNNVKYNHWLGYIPGYPHSGYGYPWCASFASWVYSHAGLTSGSYPRTASCEAGVAWYKRKGRWAGRIPHVGDQVFYGPGGGTHTEIVIAVGSKSITT